MAIILFYRISHFLLLFCYYCFLRFTKANNFRSKCVIIMATIFTFQKVNVLIGKICSIFQQLPSVLLVRCWGQARNKRRKVFWSAYIAHINQLWTSGKNFWTSQAGVIVNNVGNTIRIACAGSSRASSIHAVAHGRSMTS